MGPAESGIIVALVFLLVSASHGIRVEVTHQLIFLLTPHLNSNDKDFIYSRDETIPTNCSVGLYRYITRWH